MPRDKLTPKQERFVEQYVMHGNGAQAAIEAGYSESTAKVIAAQNLTKLNVVKRIDAERAKLRERVEIDQEWVISRLVENAERAMQRQAVTDQDGKPIGVYRYEGNVANRAVELLGKTLGMFADKPLIAVDGNLTIQQVQFEPNQLDEK